MLGSAVAALVLGPVLLPTPCWAAYVKLVIFGLTMGLLGQGADLCESALKRAVGLKDAGAVVPEFGGVLDILDSLLLSAAPGLVLLEVLKLRP
jgi:phosphatidate cytidylyltransferase